MGTPANHRSSFARSLSSIHLRQEAHFGSNDDSDDSEGNISLLKRDPRGKVTRSTSVLRCNRRSSIASSATPSPQSTAETPTHFRDKSPSLPALPFSKEGSSRDHPEKKFRRRADSEKLRRRPFVVTFAPLPELTPLPVDRQNAEGQWGGFRHDYQLGEAIRCTSDMIIEPTTDQAVQAVNSLQKHDFAFVKRSNGTYSYAILGCRSTQPIKQGSSQNTQRVDADTEECMIFVICGMGSTKMVRKTHWSESVRLVSIPR